MPETVDLRPDVLNIVVYGGDAWTLDLDLTDDEGTPLDLTGYTFAAQIRKNPDDTATIGTITVTSVNLTAGSLRLSQTAAPILTGFYDLQGTPSGGGSRTLVRGSFNATQDVTRP